MAEASIEIPVIQENIEPVGGQRNATEKRNSPNSAAKILSRYLRASPGSCHDYCKYGRKHGFEANEKVPSRMWIKARQRQARGLETTVSSADRKDMKLVTGPKPFQDSEAKKHHDLDARKKAVSSPSKKEAASSVSQEVFSALEGVDVSVEEDPDGSNSKMGQSKPSKVETGMGKESQESSSHRKTGKIRGREMRKLVLGERKVSVPPSVPLSPKHSLRRVSDITTRNSNDLKRGSHLKSQNKVKNVEPEHTSSDDVLEKTLYVIESTLENRTSEPTQDDAHTTLLSQSSAGTTRSAPSSRKNSRSTRSRSHASRSPPSPSLLKKGLRRTRQETKSTKLPLSSLQSSSSSISMSDCLDGKENGLDGMSQHETEVTEKKQKKKKIVNSKVDHKKIVNAKVERKNSTRRAGTLVSESKSSPAQKVKFRRGTILELKPEDSAPRRLKFRRVKFLGEIQNGKEDIKRASVKSNEASVAESAEFGTKTKPGKVVLRNQNAGGTGIYTRSLRRNGTCEGEVISGGAKTSSEKVISRHQNAEVPTRRSFRRRETIRGELSGISKTNSEKVVLRHRNVTGKKEVRSLFNNVIEETASKLVVTRKSKVKALVGAFETVIISLQDAKPSSATAGAS